MNELKPARVCKKCGERFEHDEQKCPKCGEVFTTKGVKIGCSILILIFVILGFYMCSQMKKAPSNQIENNSNGADNFSYMYMRRTYPEITRQEVYSVTQKDDDTHWQIKGKVFKKVSGREKGFEFSNDVQFNPDVPGQWVMYKGTIFWE